MLSRFFKYEDLSEEYIEKLNTLDVTLELLEYKLMYLAGERGINFILNETNAFNVYYTDVNKLIISSIYVEIQEKIKIRRQNKTFLTSTEIIDTIIKIV